MYKKVQTHETARLSNDVDISPVATLEDEHGGRAHIWIDDNCYVLGLEREESASLGPVKPITRVYVHPVTHIFPEAFQVLKTLPDLK